MEDWINVRYRLPKPITKELGFSVKVLVITNNKVMDITRYDYINEKWYGTKDTTIITHWMPLPKPPTN